MEGKYQRDGGAQDWWKGDSSEKEAAPGIFMLDLKIHLHFQNDTFTESFGELRLCHNGFSQIPLIIPLFG